MGNTVKLPAYPLSLVDEHGLTHVIDLRLKEHDWENFVCACDNADNSVGKWCGHFRLHVNGLYIITTTREKGGMESCVFFPKSQENINQFREGLRFARMYGK